MELFLNPSFGIPLYGIIILAILGEAYLYKRRWGKPYPWAESGVSVILTVAHGLTGFITQAVIIGIFAAAVWHWRIYTMPMDRWWSWVLLVVLEEFAYYWYHRSSHRIEFLWANHRVHHSPNELTLASAYRLAAAPILSLAWLYFMPIVWIGFQPLTLFSVVGLNLAYQFWLHSTLIPRLGPIEGILNTPSAHRVHHGSNLEYLDKNFGGTVMIFDRLFGTYVAEDPAIEIRYGLVTPEHSTNPVWVAYGGYLKLIRALWQAPSWRDRLDLLRKPPGWASVPTASGS
jgi:sterol desaturase/sphingolipid hydroxylase (fatty acid hydroxylase superfamily)